MPELPEVETIRHQLERWIVGRRINAVDVRFSGRLNLPPKKFVAGAVGRKIVSIGRRAKFLLIGLSGGSTLVIHLKMTGKLLLAAPDHEPGKHTHIVFKLSGGRTLFFDDVRKFGFMRLCRTEDVAEKVIGPARLGVEPFGKEFTVDFFAACLKKYRRAAIKPLLLSQRCVVGVGNIYSDETLWRAGIRPNRRAGTLTAAETKRLFAAIKSVLKKAIELGGSSVDDYRDANNRPGGYARLLKAYGRGGQECVRCGGIIRKIRLGGRGTHWCAGCQR